MSRQPHGIVTAVRVVLVSAVLLALIWVVLPRTSAENLSDWSPPVNVGPPVNTTYADSCASVSKNGLSLYFASSRPRPDGTPVTAWDLWVTQRVGLDDDWGEPQWLGSNINTNFQESCPALSLDEHRLFFISAGSCGGQDIFVSRRHDRRDDSGWEPAENLGCIKDGYVNGSTSEATPAFFEDELGRVIMYFAKDNDIYASVMREDDTFGPPQPVAELNSTAVENGATIRRDGLEVIFSSNRPGSTPTTPGGQTYSYDLWMATRDHTSEPWSKPVVLSDLNSPKVDGGRLSLSFDGRTLYFTSDRDGGFGGRDLYMATRTKIRQPR